ncbi:MAG: hypothetical protein HC805_02770 [Alkalinema sp. RL_2_19]|nr:hypothetical protein [Alkalinema sp. RL_2_19]
MSNCGQKSFLWGFLPGEDCLEYLSVQLCCWVDWPIVGINAIDQMQFTAGVRSFCGWICSQFDVTFIEIYGNCESKQFEQHNRV